jgi:hypothetical protein
MRLLPLPAHIRMYFPGSLVCVSCSKSGRQPNDGISAFFHMYVAAFRSVIDFPHFLTQQSIILKSSFGYLRRRKHITPTRYLVFKYIAIMLYITLLTTKCQVTYIGMKKLNQDSLSSNKSMLRLFPSSSDGLGQISLRDLFSAREISSGNLGIDLYTRVHWNQMILESWSVQLKLSTLGNDSYPEDRIV